MPFSYAFSDAGKSIFGKALVDQVVLLKKKAGDTLQLVLAKGPESNPLNPPPN
jgi:hypothetical protein